MKLRLLKSGAGDWVGLYDELGLLVDEGHSLDWEWLLPRFGIEIESVTGGEYLEEYAGCCPQHWSEVQSEA